MDYSSYAPRPGSAVTRTPRNARWADISCLPRTSKDMTTILDNSPASFAHLLGALQKARSIAAEGGYLDLLSPNEDLGLPGMDPFVGNDKTVDLLASLASGERECNAVLWMNLCYMVENSASWSVSLGARGVMMPERTFA